jgi:hypothetical protein
MFDGRSQTADARKAFLNAIVDDSWEKNVTVKIPDPWGDGWRKVIRSGNYHSIRTEMLAELSDPRVVCAIFATSLNYSDIGVTHTLCSISVTENGDVITHVRYPYPDTKQVKSGWNAREWHNSGRDAELRKWLEWVEKSKETTLAPWTNGTIGWRGVRVCVFDKKRLFARFFSASRTRSGDKWQDVGVAQKNLIIMERLSSPK